MGRFGGPGGRGHWDEEYNNSQKMTDSQVKACLVEMQTRLKAQQDEMTKGGVLTADQIIKWDLGGTN